MTVEDVTTAMKIWGPSVTKAKGNTVQQPAKASPTYTHIFKKILQYMIIYMVFATTKVMNMFPQKGGNVYYSPGMIMTGMGVLIE